ncbi:hypothetical protein [Streptomyces sp. NBC_00690]|uniref:hypothetical protein n=1 Tax=Streptomyces sp. NBC_00690 TaxID=2975808 RepID=UPI002E2AFF84|nr:hypothetical protein [Streptomyces sp. NBC_00690]
MSGQDTEPMNIPGTERQLREAMEALAGQVHPAPDAYRTARGEWQRRERRRRLVLTLLVTVVFTLATLAGLWVLNSAPPGSPGIFHDDRPPGPTSPATVPFAPALPGTTGGP